MYGLPGLPGSSIPPPPVMGEVAKSEIDSGSSTTFIIVGIAIVVIIILIILFLTMKGTAKNKPVVNVVTGSEEY